MNYYPLDIGNHESVDKGVAQVVKDLGQIDILINNVCRVLMQKMIEIWDR